MSGGLSDGNRAPRRVVRRTSSASARRHMSKAAVDRDVLTFAQMSERRRVEHLAGCRWGDKELVICPHCNTGTKHGFREKELRWKCASCDKTFSVTSGTLFSHRKVSTKHLLAQTHAFASGASGQPSLETRRNFALISYNGPYTHGMKLREGLVRGRNVGLLTGIVELDGSHVSGKNSVKRRGKPLNWQEPDPPEVEPGTAADGAAPASKPAFDSSKLTGTSRQKARKDAQAKGEAFDPTKRGFGSQYHEDRRNAFVVQSRSKNKGQGALQTRVGLAMSESPLAIAALVEDFMVPPETILATDTTANVSKVTKGFQFRLAVNHSETLVGPNGEHINNAEAFFARLDRAEKGIYKKLMPKYLHDYLCELAVHDDYAGTAPGAKAAHILFYAMNVGRSHHWIGFTHGKHRDFEIGVPENRPAKASGPKPKKERKATDYVRPPR